MSLPRKRTRHSLPKDRYRKRIEGSSLSTLLMLLALMGDDCRYTVSTSLRIFMKRSFFEIYNERRKKSDFSSCNLCAFCRLATQPEIMARQSICWGHGRLRCRFTNDTFVATGSTPLLWPSLTETGTRESAVKELEGRPAAKPIYRVKRKHDHFREDFRWARQDHDSKEGREHTLVISRYEATTTVQRLVMA